MTIQSIPSQFSTYALPSNDLDLANLDHSRALWFGVFAIVSAIIVYGIRAFTNIK